MRTDGYGSANVRYLFASVSIALCGAFFGPPGIPAQDVQAAAQRTVRCFAASHSEDKDEDGCADPLPSEIGVPTHPDEYGAYLDEVMNGLAELAVVHPEFRVRVAAAIHMTALGNRAQAPRNAPGVVERARRLYERSDERAVRSALIRWMPWQAEEEAAVAFLEAVARSERSPEEQMWPEELLAVDALAQMGERGRAALRRLDDGGIIPNDLARQRLDDLRATGYHLDSVHGNR